MSSLDPRSMGGVRELIAYATVVLLAWLIALLLRTALRGGGGTAGEPAPEHVAYLTGGPTQAVYAAVAALRSTGSVRAAGSRIWAGGPSPHGVGPIAAAVHHAAQAAQAGLAVNVLPTHPAVRAELDRAGDHLRRQDALLSTGRRRALALTALPLFALTLFGATRLALNLPTDERPGPVDFLVILLTIICALAALITGIVLVGNRPIRTRGADRLVRDLRRRHDALAPRHNPSLAANGPAAATLAVGLFGTAALFTADPEFARAADVDEQRVKKGGGYRGDAGYPDSNDSGCGSGGSCGTS